MSDHTYPYTHPPTHTATYLICSLTRPSKQTVLPKQTELSKQRVLAPTSTHTRQITLTGVPLYDVPRGIVHTLGRVVERSHGVALIDCVCASVARACVRGGVCVFGMCVRVCVCVDGWGEWVGVTYFLATYPVHLPPQPPHTHIRYSRRAPQGHGCGRADGVPALLRWTKRTGTRQVPVSWVLSWVLSWVEMGVELGVELGGDGAELMQS